MKKTVIRVVLFVLLFFIIDQLIFRIYRYEIFDRPYSYGSLSRIYSGTINTDIVIFGSSRTLLQVDPAVIEENTHLSAYNLAVLGTNIWQSLFTLEEYLLHNKKPKLVIFEADLKQIDKNYHLLFEKNKFSDYSFLSKHTSDLFSFSRLDNISRSLVKSQVAANNLDVIYSFFTKTLFGNKEKEAKIKDFGDWIFSSGAQLKKVSLIDQTGIEKVDYEIEVSVVKRRKFEKVAQFIESKKIPLLLFSPPVGWWRRGVSQEESISFFENIAKRNKFVTYVDLSFDSDFPFGPRLWWDKNHLNKDGASLLSRKISLEINTMKIEN